MKHLLAEELWSSAEILGSLLLSSSRGEQGLELYGDALFGKGEYKRAQAYYRQAIQRRRVAQGARRGGYGASSAAEDEAEARLKFREARCCVALDEVGAAINTLEAIPAQWRGARAHVTLGRLYKNTGLKRNAIASFEAALAANPLCLEAVEPLAQLGATPRRDRGPAAAPPWTSTAPRRRPRRAAAAAAWRGSSLRARDGAMHRHEYGHAIEHWGAVEQIGGFPRVADNLNLDYMDHCAVLAKRRGQANDLNRLAHDLVSTNRKRPEAWIAVALYAETRGETEKALGFVEKAIALDSRHVLAFQLRGELLLGMGKAEHAIVAYFQANNYAKDLASYKGLVAAYLSTRKYKEALCTAKEAVATLPNNAAAISLVGKVLATSPEGTDKAKRAFAKALSIDKSCTDAALALVDLHVANQEYAQSIELLLHSLQSLNHDFLHTKLADVYVLNEQYSDALAYYHAAISLNPQSEAANAGIDRLEKLMHGVDPDLDDDDDTPHQRTANSADDDVLDSTAYL
ncbi:hypothetical protein JL722_10416 [Aureococcus anophagefferens]|nr:hypothetical protein JL722_10416 [Aureococcus anophagefferens]